MLALTSCAYVKKVFHAGEEAIREERVEEILEARFSHYFWKEISAQWKWLAGISGGSFTIIIARLAHLLNREKRKNGTSEIKVNEDDRKINTGL